MTIVFLGKKWKDIGVYLFFCGLLMVLLACSRQADDLPQTISPQFAGFGAIRLRLVWIDIHDATDINMRQSQAIVTNSDGTIDCGASGIATIYASVSDASDTFLVDNGSGWSCEDHQGTLLAVPAGTGRKVTVQARDASGTELYRGEQSNITVVAGQAPDTLAPITITMAAVSGTDTPPSSPVVTTGSADSITYQAATLGGTINPNGNSLTWYFEYGTATSYGSTTSEVAPTSFDTSLSVSETITGLTSDTTYHYRLVVKTASGNLTGKDAVFSTIDNIRPLVSQVTPADKGIDQDLETTITAAFSEDMDAGSITVDSFYLNDGVSDIVCDVQYNNKVATLVPRFPLDPDTTYTVTLTTSVTDSAGNGLAGNYSWDFTTLKYLWVGIDSAIVKLSSLQSALLQLNKINNKGLSGLTQFAVDPADNSLWFSDTNNDRIIKLDATGRLITLINQWSASGTVVDPRDSSAWSSKLYQNPNYNRTLVNFSPMGFQQSETAGNLALSMFDNAMSWDTSDNSIWYANYDTDVVKLMNTGSLNGYDASGASSTNHIRISGFDGQPFEVSAFTGSGTLSPCVWVADRGGNIVKLSTDGTELWKENPAGMDDIRFVSADQTDGSVWIAGTGTPWRVAKYANTGTEMVSPVPIDSIINTIETDSTDGGVWVGTDDALIRLDASGNEISRYSGNVQSIAFFITTRSAKTIYVATTGNDTTGYGTQTAPYLTIGKALQMASAGDTIFVSTGTYTENITLKTGVNLLGAGSSSTTIQGLGNTHTVEGLSIKNVTIAGFTITGSGNSESGIYCDVCTNLTIRNNLIQDNGDYFGAGSSDGIYLSGASEALIQDNVITHNADTGILISGDSRVHIRNNIITKNYDRGISRGSGSYVSFIQNNVIYANGNHNSGWSGIMMYSNDVITNNIITNNGGDNPNSGYSVGIYVSTTATPELSHNDVWNNYQGEYTNVSAGSGDITQNPLFADPSTGDFTLQTTSPCIDTGDASLYDADASRSDMGAYGGPW